MSGYAMGLPMENIRVITVMILDIFIMWFLLYYVIKLVRNNSRTIQIFKGILLVILTDGVAKLMGLKTVSYVTDIFINWGFLAIIIIFQPEIRSVLERIGKSNAFSRITTLTGNEKEHLVDQIVTAAMLLSKDQTGALISIEQSHSLEDFIATGTRLNSDVTAELLTSIFVTSTPLHDGAVIIQGDRIACASAYFPPTNLELPSRYGARHRAAIGISEITDAVTIVVSEETGAISVTEGGKIYQFNRKELRDYLLRVILGEETEVKTSRPDTVPAELGREVVIDDKAPVQVKESSRLRDKLAVKKQDTGRMEKIEVEEVTPAEPLSEPENLRKGDAPDDTLMIKLEEEASDIKLPRKKERPAPSYPQHAAGNRFEEDKQTVKANEEAPADVLVPPEVPAAEPVVEEPAKQEPAARLTSEDIKRMRNQLYAQYSNANKEQEPEPVPEPVTEPQKPAASQADDMLAQLHRPTESEKMFDTTKLDISKIVGLNDDLDETFEILDQMPSDKPSDRDKGGDR